jgi:predicted transcriptional regulator
VADNSAKELHMSDDTFIQLTAHVVSAHVSNNTVASDKLAGLIEIVFTALSNAASPKAPEIAKLEPAVSIRASIRPDYIVCLEDGVKLKTLKRHLHTTHNMTPAEYRAKWNLPSDYPLVSSNYSETRRKVSLASGLGRKKALATEPVEEAPIAAKKRGRTKAPIAEPTITEPAIVEAPILEPAMAKAASAEPAIVAPAVAEKPARKPRAKKAAPEASE